MLLIPCPWCGPRDESEFAYGGEAHVVRPPDSEKISDAEWADYLFMSKNPLGSHLEQWCHTAGCRRWFNAQRDTATYEFGAIYKVAESPPGGRQQ